MAKKQIESYTELYIELDEKILNSKD